MKFSHSRRTVIRQLGLGSLAGTFPAILYGQSRGQAAGRNALQIPPLFEGVPSTAGQLYSLTMQQGETEFFNGVRTQTLGINGNYLGPTLRLLNGEQVAMDVNNQMQENTTLHWHGLHVPAVADGGPAQIIAPGTIWQPRFEVMQQAGTFWYHSHAMGQTGSQVYHGLAGMIILDDEESLTLQLPREYGVDDIPLILQDKRFNADGSLAYVGMRRDIMTGFFGDTILVNGTLNPQFSPTTEKVRFRLLNGSNARTYTLAFSDQRSFSLIGSGGSFLPSPLVTNTLILAPAERAEIVVDFSDGRATTLVTTELPADSGFRTQGMMSMMTAMVDQEFDLLEITPQTGLASSPALPRQLTTLTRIAESEARRTRRFTLNMMMGMGMGGPGGGGGGRMNMSAPFSINGRAMDMDVINERVTMGDTEIWEIVNDTMMLHPFHVHHNQFQILDRNGSPPRADEVGFKDTVKVGPGETVRFIMRFENFSDPDNAYMYHCHILEHEDNGMMGQFVVV